MDELMARARAMFLAAPDVRAVLEAIRTSGLPDAWLASGALYAAIWNALTGRPPAHGVKDYDVIYFDPDESWDAEDRAIRAFAAQTESLGLPIELRNQARVHLWYPQRFGAPYPKLGCATESLLYYASRTHAVATRFLGDDVEVIAPFGLEDVFALRVTPNPALDNRGTHERKGARIRQVWPEVEIIPWPETAAPYPVNSPA